MHDDEVRRSALDPASGSGPLLLEAAPSLDSAPAWVARNRTSLQDLLRRHAAVLLRGFGVMTAVDFEAMVAPLVDDWMDYRDRASKRSPIAGRVMTSTDTPPAFNIEQHCESSFTVRWPRLICFHCELPAATGGRTPLTDIRGVTHSIDPGLRERFEREGVLYMRTFGDGLGMDWRDVFQVADREGLARYCEAARVDHEWLADGRLRTWQVRPAFAPHPETGEPLWFNHALALHASALDPKLRAALMRQSGEDGLPHNTYFGSGAPISDAVAAEIRRAHHEHTIRFDWQRGDVLLLDNMLAAHGREPYSGARRVTTMMANPWTWEAAGAILGLPKARPAMHGAPLPADTGTAAPAADRTGPAAPPGAAGAQLETWLLRAVAAELSLAEVRLDDNLMDLGGDSLVAVSLADALYGDFGVDLPIEVFLQAENLGEVVSQIGAARAA